MDFHEDIRRRLKSIRESILTEKNIEEKEKVKDNGKRRKKKKRRK